jgi:hypothetical protein
MRDEDKLAEIRTKRQKAHGREIKREDLPMDLRLLSMERQLARIEKRLEALEFSDSGRTDKRIG